MSLCSLWIPPQCFLIDYKTGGRANILWLDGHVTPLEETTGDDVRLKWYTGAAS